MLTPPVLRRRDSLRWQLPVIISLMIVVVLGTFLWMTRRALEQTLLRASGERAENAAEQIATLMTQSVAKGLVDIKRIADNDAVLQFMSQRSDDNAARVRATLQPLTAVGQPPVEIWGAHGDCLLQVGPTSSASGPSLPAPGPAPGPAGLSGFHAVGETVFYELIAEIDDRPPVAGEPPAARRIGALVVRRSLVPAQTVAINRLVGNGGLVEVGNRSGDVWSDFAKPRPAPLVDTTRNLTAEYRAPGGERKIGALHLIAGTPWVAWIEFSRDSMLAPAQAVFRRMLALGSALVLVAAALASVVSWWITKPLHDLTNVSEAMAAGDLTKRVRADRRDEIGRLGSSFNAMAARVAAAQRELEARVAERTAGLRDALGELEAFSYSVSHDLRAPLRHVVGFASLLEQSSAAILGDEGRRHLKTIIEAANRMGRLIDDLLAFSRVGRTPIASRRVDLNQLVAEAQAEVMGSGAGANVAWTIRDLPAVHGDPALLRLVLINLLSNAVKYSSRVPHPAVELGTVPAGPGEVAIFVRDNGEGFDMQYAHKLFGVFQRLHANGDFEGTGIGLANVRRIVQRHGGRTWAEGIVKGGATFYFSLPVQGGAGERHDG
ncbi:MAG TPA: ATP-binding protein [Vicinamibacterales bacterium]|nr:ATP-binding protein [Vicinamibacterales bacterium]